MTPRSDVVLQVVQHASGRAASVVRQEMKRRVDSLASIAVTAPLVGFFGTVIGFLSSFRGAGTERSTMLHWYLREFPIALGPTVLGLLVSVSALWFYKYLVSRIEGFDTEMKNGTSELISCLAHLLSARRTLKN